MSIFDNILNPAKDIGNLVNSILSKFVADPTQKAELAAAFAAKQQELEAAVLDASKETVLAEEHGELWIQKAWRPIVSMGLFAIILYAGVAVSIFALPQINMSGVSPELWSTFKLCVGGYMGLRSGEKIASMFTNGNGKNHNGDSQ